MGQKKQQKQKARQKKASKHSAKTNKVRTSKVPTITGGHQSLVSKLPPFRRHTSFKTFPDAIKHSWHNTYLIAKGRPTEDGQMRILSLGTGFLAGRQRMITCAHCVSNEENVDPMSKHQDGDVYFFVARDGVGNFHSSTVTTLKLNESLFIYPEKDLAVIYLPDSFYTDGTKVYKHPDDYLELLPDFAPLGTEVGVIGYPFQMLQGSSDQSGLDLSGIAVRVDKGVVNTNYTQAGTGLAVYEFTMNFNPGNSGGPIIDPNTGKVIAWVKGFSSTAIEINDGKDKAKIYAHYSMGVATKNLLDIAAEHNLAV
jgi:hypothetical protein